MSPFEVIWMRFLCHKIPVEICSCCHVQPPQQVALTDINSQVNAQVGPIPQTCIGQSSFFASSSVVFSRVPVAMEMVFLAQIYPA